jgi:hypothetical protein
MRALSAHDIVRLWEWGQDKHPVDRALMVLSLAQPELSGPELAGLSVGQRNARLLTVRERTLGARLDGFAKCPRCCESLEFDLEVGDILHPEVADQEFVLEYDGYTLHCRLPNSGDLVAVVTAESIERARRVLIERCIQRAEKAGEAQPVIATADLPDSLLPALSEAVRRHDPQSDMHFALACAACGHEWSVQFDIAAFLWTELGDRSRRLRLDVHTLARAYGWHEDEILKMSAAGRQFYLDLNLSQA